MSAYDDLFDELGEARGLGRMSSGWARLVQDLDAFKAEIAHELAEEIRNSKKLRDRTDDHMSDCSMAADLIDPEVSDG